MTSRLRIFLVGLSAGLLLFVCAADAKEKAEEEARPLLKAAAERSLFHPDTHASFSLILSFELWSPSLKMVPGKYSWLVTPEGNWRKEATFPDYSDLEVGRGTTLWVKRNINARPLQAGWIENSFSNFAYLDRAEDEMDRYFKTSDHHIELRCVTLHRDKAERTLCFDPENNLRKVEMKDSKTTYEYSDFRPVGKKFAPYKIVAKREGQVVFDGIVESLSPDPQVEPSQLAIPDGAIQRAGCLSPSWPKLKDKVIPVYPRAARDQHQQGTVIAYALIASDGTVRDPVVIRTTGQNLDSSVLEAVRRWKYEPAKCGDVPVEFEMEIPVNFTLEIW
jgi:TonB family protein